MIKKGGEVKSVSARPSASVSIVALEVRRRQLGGGAVGQGGGEGSVEGEGVRVMIEKGGVVVGD